MTKIQIIFEGKELTHSRFNEIEKCVLEYFGTLWKQVKESIDILRTGNKALIKSELCLAFIKADALSRFGAIIRTGEEEKNNEKRLRKWFDDFVLTDKNEAYLKNKKHINCNSSTLWSLRNSLLHFYGLPKSETEFVGFGQLSEETKKRFKDLVRKDHPGKQVILIDPYILINAIQYGFVSQGEILSEMIRSNDDVKKEIYAKGIVKCYEIIQTEGSVYVPFENHGLNK